MISERYRGSSVMLLILDFFSGIAGLQVYKHSFYYYILQYVPNSYHIFHNIIVKIEKEEVLPHNSTFHSRAKSSAQCISRTDASEIKAAFGKS